MHADPLPLTPVDRETVIGWRVNPLSRARTAHLWKLNEDQSASTVCGLKKVWRGDLAHATNPTAVCDHCDSIYRIANTLRMGQPHTVPKVRTT